MSKTVQEIMEVMGKTVEVTMKLERKNGSSYAHIADITPEDINEIRYYFDGALYRSVMRCLEVKLKGDWTAKAKKGLLLDSLKLTVTHPEGDRATIGYGGFYIAEAPEYDAAQNLTSIIAYDELYLSMQPYTASLWQSGITVKNYLIAILNKLGINYDTNSLSLMANADKKITSEKFLDIENDSTEAAYTYRDILDEIAKASGVTFAFKNSLGGDPFKLYAIKPTESGYVIDESNLRSVTIGAKYGPVMGVVLSREPQEDNVIYPSNLTDSQTAVKISNVEIMEDSGNDAYRETFIQGIYNNVKNTEYYLYELDSFGIGFLNFGDIFTLKVCERKNGEIGDEKEYKTIFMRTDMTVGDGIKEKSKLEAPQATSTDYAAASTTDKALKKTMLKVDKQEQRITALVKETDEKYSKLTQTVDGFETEIANTKSGLEAKIKATAESFEATYAKKETVAGQIKGITDQLEGIDGKIEDKVTTEVQKDTTISILAGKVESKISGNYVTKATYDDEKKNWLLKTTYDSYVKQTDQNIEAAVSRVQKLEDAEYITKTQCSSLISAQADKIALTVESNLKYESRNLLMDSECFEHLTPSGYHATYVSDYVATGQSYLPSGKARQLKFKAESAEAGIKFSAADTVGGKDKIKPKTTYTLSFWARLYNDNDNAPQNLYWQESVYTATSPNGTVYDNNRTRGLEINGSWHKVVIVFTTPENVSDFQLRFALTGCVTNQLYTIVISSLKLEIGNVATEWATRTPSTEEVEEYAKSEIAQLPDKITLSVEKNLKIGARNILLDSACFKSFTPSGFYSGSIATLPYTDSSLPSGSYKRMSFTTTRSDSCGVQFDSVSIIGQALGSIDKIKPGTTYTLSFWLKSSSHNGEKLDRERMIYCGENNFPTFDGQRCKIPTISSSWQKYVVVFNTPAAISEFRLRFCILACTSGESIAIDISSLKLEEGTIATDWTPSTDDIDQSVKSVQAKIDMCVQKDENNNLVSEINIASNKLAINTDNFTLAKDGTMSCTGATITGGTILCGDTNTSMLIAQGAIVHKFDGTEIGQIGLTMNPDSSGNMQYYERISGTVGVQISANNYATFVDDAGFVVCSNARDTTINVSISSTTDWSYASYSSALRSIVEADSALIVSANRGNNNLYLEGSSVVICGQLTLPSAIGVDSTKSYVYVVADKKTGEISFLSA